MSLTGLFSCTVNFKVQPRDAVIALEQVVGGQSMFCLALYWDTFSADAKISTIHNGAPCNGECMCGQGELGEHHTARGVCCTPTVYLPVLRTQTIFLSSAHPALHPVKPLAGAL